MSTDAVRHQWDILADGLDPIIESLEGFDKAVRERMKSLKRLHHSSLSFGGLFADVWNKSIKLDVGRVQRGEAVRVWLQQHDLAAVASEVDERRRNLIESFQTWKEQARPAVEWNENTISVLKQIPNSGGIEWPESEKPKLIGYLGDDHADSLQGICGKVAELVTYLKMQRGTVARRLAANRQSGKTTPPADPSSEVMSVERQAETLAGGKGAGDGQLQVKPCEGKAWSQFQEAVGKNSELTTDRQAYDWFTDEMADDAGELPSFANWSRYLRAARKAMNQGKNGPRIGNETRSVVSVERIEQPRKRIEADRR